MQRMLRAACGVLAMLAAGAVPALAQVTVLGWPGGPEETALRAAAEALPPRETRSHASCSLAARHLTAGA